MDEIDKINTGDKENDIIGRVYEYFLSKFALAEGNARTAARVVQNAIIRFNHFCNQIDNTLRRIELALVMENAKQDDIALKIDTALYTIEKANPALKGALPDNYYSRLHIDTAIDNTLRRIELALALAFRKSKLAQEVFVDPPDNVILFIAVLILSSPSSSDASFAVSM